MAHGASARQGLEPKLEPKGRGGVGRQLTSGNGVSQWRWSMMGLGRCSAQSCTTRAASRASRNTKRRMERGRRSSSPRGGRGGGVTPTGQCSDEDGDLAGPRAAPAYGSAPRPAQGEREAVRWVGVDAQRRNQRKPAAEVVRPPGTGERQWLKQRTAAARLTREENDG
jgi:hypothetical protein